ncbi:4-phosphoerythronate dehydrogenase [Marinobacter lacisalsi]|uniref:Erythronate-4-phosphate dehydrogenase n=1 Tax=Marinobacter lacisalsi TaxID=475979 RepID=A0ABV8QLW0_9GAMM
MRIVADENIPLLEAFCGDVGALTRVNGRSLIRDQLRDADVLLVRSVTRVDAALLAGTNVRFVGTATIGTDHVDTQWLARQGITFSSAPGCNASSVVQYVLSVLSVYLVRQQRPGFDGLSVGVIGAGNVGGALVQRLLALGVNVRVSDPPRQQQGADLPFASLDDVLQCDVVSLHTPLTTAGPHATAHLLDAALLSRLGAGQLLINSGRGPVIDNRALLERMREPEAPLVALDVWENEPEPLPELVDSCWLATPHIAGCSLEGKCRGTEMIARALHQWAGADMPARLASVLPPPLLSELHFTDQVEPMDALHRALMACYDPRDDDSRLRGALARADAAGNPRGAAFDEQRKRYPVRREPSSLAVRVPPGSDTAKGLSKCGFEVIEASKA